MTTDQYLASLKSVRAQIPSEFERIVDRSKEVILDFNREDQLFDRGIDSDGNKLQPYTPTTVRYKRSKGEVFNRTTLLDTGDFYKGFDLLKKPNDYSIFSRDEKSADLVEKYGNIFGLTKENTERVNEDVLRPQLNDFIIKSI